MSTKSLHRQVAENMAKTMSCGHLSVDQIEAGLREMWGTEEALRQGIREIGKEAQEMLKPFYGADIFAGNLVDSVLM